MRGLVIAASAMVGVTVLAGDALARDILVPRDFRKLQDALDAAGPADRVLVRKRTLRGYHTITTDGVEVESAHPRGTRLKGRAKRQGRLGVAGLVEVHADGVTVRGFEFLRGGLHVFGDDVLVEDCTFRDQTPGDYRATALHVEGDRPTIRDADIDMRHRGDVYVLGIEIEGDGAVVTGSRVEAGEQALALLVTGDDPRIEGNSLGKVSGTILARVNGDRAVVSDNRFRGDSVAIFSGDGLVSGNLAEDADFGDAAVRVVGNGSRVLDNEVRRSADTGILVWGDRNLIQGNRVTDAGTRSVEGVRLGNGFVVRGSANRIHHNSAERIVGEGFRIAGNTEAETGADGVYVPGTITTTRGPGNELVGCTGNQAGRCGIGNWTLDTVVSGCTFQGNGADVVDGGSFDFFQGNTYTTGGPGYTGGGDGVYAPDVGFTPFDPQQLTWE